MLSIKVRMVHFLNPELRNSMFWFESLVEGGGGSVQVFELKFKECIGVGENTIRNGT